MWDKKRLAVEAALRNNSGMKAIRCGIEQPLDWIQINPLLYDVNKRQMKTEDSLISK